MPNFGRKVGVVVVLLGWGLVGRWLRHAAATRLPARDLQACRDLWRWSALALVPFGAGLLLSLVDPEGLLLPGLYVRAALTQGVDTHGILVPQQAVGRDPKGDPTVLVVDEKNMARLRPIRTGRAVGNQWQVLDGLKVGEKVIVEGLAKVQPDMPVAPQEIAAKK